MLRSTNPLSAKSSIIWAYTFSNAGPSRFFAEPADAVMGYKLQTAQPHGVKVFSGHCCDFRDKSTPDGYAYRMTLSSMTVLWAGRPPPGYALSIQPRSIWSTTRSMTRTMASGEISSAMSGGRSMGWCCKTSRKHLLILSALP